MAQASDPKTLRRPIHKPYKFYLHSELHWLDMSINVHIYVHMYKSINAYRNLHHFPMRPEAEASSSGGGPSLGRCGLSLRGCRAQRFQVLRRPTLGA